jgi:hypothetical protein
MTLHGHKGSCVAATPQLRWHIEVGILTPFVCILLQSHNVQGHVELRYSLTTMRVKNAIAPLFMIIFAAKRGNKHQ